MKYGRSFLTSGCIVGHSETTAALPERSMARAVPRLYTGPKTSNARAGQCRIPVSKLIRRKPASKAKAANYASVHMLPLASRAQIREIQALLMFGGSGAKFTRSSLASCL